MDKKRKMIRTDTGGKYESPFAGICFENGITPKYYPFSPKSNEIAIRKNWRLKEMLSVLISSCLL